MSADMRLSEQVCRNTRRWPSEALIMLRVPPVAMKVERTQGRGMTAHEGVMLPFYTHAGVVITILPAHQEALPEHKVTAMVTPTSNMVL